MCPNQSDYRAKYHLKLRVIVVQNYTEPVDNCCTIDPLEVQEISDVINRSKWVIDEEFEIFDMAISCRMTK